MDPRFRLLHLPPGKTGLSAGRNFGMAHLSPSVKFVSMLDDDDLWELAGLEKSVWALLSHPTAAAVSGQVVNFGALNFTWTKGFHLGKEIYALENTLVAAWVYRRSVAEKCPYDEHLQAAEDWDFWLCMAEHGLWGVHMHEPIFWYQRNSLDFRQKRWPDLKSPEELKLRITRRHTRLFSYFPALETPEFDASRVRLEIPFENRFLLTRDKSKHAIVVTSSLKYPSCAFAITRDLVLDGWDVTVVNTLREGCGTVESLAPWLELTHDVFSLPSFLLLEDQPRFISYLVRSREPSVAYIDDEDAVPLFGAVVDLRLVIADSSNCDAQKRRLSTASLASSQILPKAASLNMVGLVAYEKNFRGRCDLRVVGC